MRMRRAPLLCILLGAFTLVSAQGLPRDVRLNIVQAVVQVIPYDIDAGTTVGWSGSGTIISPSGYVLTNYHVVGDERLRYNYEWHAILITDPAFTDQPPEFMFWARYVAGDPTHDLAILKIVEWFDEEPVGDDLVFPYVYVGDSNQLIPGDSITIVGYPGISGSTITFTAGLMSGWLGEDFESGGKQWIKTDAKIAHGNSGGGAFDENGYLIGVPTAGRTVKYEELDIEEQAYVRPISLAWALIGPHVPDVARAPASNASARPSTNTSTGANTAPATAAVCDYCTVGQVQLGATATGTLRGVGEDPNYHTYVVNVPAGTPSLTIDIAADGDVDFVVKYGADITNWGDDGDWVYRDITNAKGGTFTVPNPTPGPWYVDVIFAYRTGAAGYSIKAR